MRQGAVMVDAEGLITFASEHFSEIVGRTDGGLLRSRLADLVADPDRDHYQGMLRAREDRQKELRLRAANGADVTTLSAVTAVQSHKLFLFADLTLQKRHEASDERTRKFLGVLAHEFRNILGPIINSTEILKRSGPRDPDAKKAIEMIERQTARLLGLVEDLRLVNPKE